MALAAALPLHSAWHSPLAGHGHLAAMAGVITRLRVAAAAPVARAALTSATVMAAGDALCQSIANHRQSKAVDWHRTARFSVIGLTLHGPLFFHGFRALDKHIGSAPTLRLVRAYPLLVLLEKQPIQLCAHQTLLCKCAKWLPRCPLLVVAEVLAHPS